MKTIATDKRIAIVGLGATGLSCVRFLTAHGHSLIVLDSRNMPPGAEELKLNYPQVETLYGKLCVETLCAADEIILSPGVPLSHDSIRAANDAGVRIRGDIDLFAEAANAPIVAITGSNGKSTVTTWLGEILSAAGRKVGVGGNLGIPALDLLNDDNELYVLELSSFQLETTHQLNADVCVLLNLSEDHMDRYDDKLQYLRAKQRIFFGAKHIVINADDILSQPLLAEGVKTSFYGLNGPDIGKVSVISEGQDEFIVDGFEKILNTSQLKVKGRHNVSNALAVVALAKAFGVSRESIVKGLSSYNGLAHRCQWVRQLHGVDYFNDSKGTNPGATEVAVKSLGEGLSGKVVLIAGGESKGLDMAVLEAPMREFGRAAVLMGADAPLLAEVLEPVVDVFHAESMKDAVERSQQVAQSGDVVLLSPACASFDMFKNFEQRGECFVSEVNAL